MITTPSASSAKAEPLAMPDGRALPPVHVVDQTDLPREPRFLPDL
jgi:hypothetical protein